MPTDHPLNIAVIGAGNIGGNVARQAARAGHSVTVSFARDGDALHRLADEIGAEVATPADAVAAADLVVFSVPWRVIPQALEQAGDLRGRIVVDTTNQFGDGPKPQPGQTAASFNAARMAGARYTKSFNTLTAGFQAQTAGRAGEDRVVQWLCGDDDDAKTVVARVINEMGYQPVDLGGTAGCTVMEAPRRPGAVYGEEYRLLDAHAVVAAVRAARPIPQTPAYG